MNVLPTSKLALLNIKWPILLTPNCWLEPYKDQKVEDRRRKDSK